MDLIPNNLLYILIICAHIVVYITLCICIEIDFKKAPPEHTDNPNIPGKAMKTRYI